MTPLYIYKKNDYKFGVQHKIEFFFFFGGWKNAKNFIDTSHQMPKYNLRGVVFIFYIRYSRILIHFIIIIFYCQVNK